MNILKKDNLIMETPLLLNLVGDGGVTLNSTLRIRSIDIAYVNR